MNSFLQSLFNLRTPSQSEVEEAQRKGNVREVRFTFFKNTGEAFAVWWSKDLHRLTVDLGTIAKEEKLSSSELNRLEQQLSYEFSLARQRAMTAVKNDSDDSDEEGDNESEEEIDTYVD